MRLDRRRVLLGGGGLTLLAAAGPGIASPFPRGGGAGVGEIWGLAYWSRGAMPHPAPVPRSRTAVPSWHPDFICAP